MLDWKNYRLKLKNRIGAFGKLQPKTLQGYQALSQAGEDSPLDLKTRELIAPLPSRRIAMAVLPCMWKRQSKRAARARKLPGHWVLQLP